jgi:uncharacterized protein (TIGR02145 family)
MKKFFLFLISLMGLGFSASAQSHINIELLGATYTTPAVQFRISWDAIPSGTCHNSKIWLWVDFIKIENNQPSGSWTRATVVSPSPGTVAPETDKGFWLQGSSSNYSQTVMVALSNIPVNTTFNWCAYASDCPPNVTAVDGTYTFNGTLSFTLIASNGATQPVTGTTLAASALTITPTTIMDATACPGAFCPYRGNDLYIDSTHPCLLRSGGAGNWEAWIKDTRDNELYRIVFMPDNHWWMAEYMRYDASSIGKSYKCPNKTQQTIYNRPSVACPSSWILPSVANYNNLVSVASFNSLKATTGACSGTDDYGFTLIADGSWYNKVGNSGYPTGNCSGTENHSVQVDTSNQLRYHIYYANTGETTCTSYGYTNTESWNQSRCISQL